MNTIVKVLGLGSAAASEKQLVELIDAESELCASAGDLLGAGEWYASRLAHCTQDETDLLLAKVLTLWACPADLSFSPTNAQELVDNLEQLGEAEFAVALVCLICRHGGRLKHTSTLLTDLVFRLSQHIERTYEIEAGRPLDKLQRASLKVRTVINNAKDALESFKKSKCISARAASLEVAKKNRLLKPFLLLRERSILSQVDILLGGAFREFCINYERGETEKLIAHLSEIREQAQQVATSKAHYNSVLWHLLVLPVAEHVIALVDEATRTSKLAAKPELRLTSNNFKVDLSKPDTRIQVSALLANDGAGNAIKVHMDSHDSSRTISVASPRSSFDLAPGRETVVVLEIQVSAPAVNLTIPVVLDCRDAMNERHRFKDTLRFEQQRPQPNWNLLQEDPPYTVNPIKSRERLFGREAQLNELLLNAAAGTSTFVWGQKRVGKTSLLQVLMSEILKRPRFVCVFLRMGELVGMHEGQIAFTVASRIAGMLQPCPMAVPSEAEFGAGLAKLIPFFEQLSNILRDWRFIVIIDEFDDLEPAFYTGERGRIFVKGLRSLSEIGMTFFFAGSERMTVIYARHALELNKWTNVFVDSIASAQDCRDLIVKPLHNLIDYEPSSVGRMAEYSRGNPFFMHLVCQQLFKHCLADRRTYISDADFSNERDSLTETLGPTNFAHLWSDNQILDKDENVRYSAENCLILSCIALTRGAFRSVDELWEQQDNLNLTSTERLSAREFAMVVERLRARKIISEPQSDKRLHLTLPIFGDWLAKNAELHLLPIWRKFAAEKGTTSTSISTAESQQTPIFVSENFPIPEDELLSAAQNLVFCGKQKDVAEIRQWLRQFDDPSRIEIAFLLLKRLAEKGYISDGNREYSIGKMTDAINARRLEIGEQKWKVARGRKDNLCISHVDSDLKSGATLARELIKRMSPGKAGDAEDVSYWLKSRMEADPILVLVDDFSGTGDTITKGLQKWFKAVKEQRLIEKLIHQRRVFLGILFAFGEAIDAIAELEPRLQIFCSKVFGSEVRAFEEDAAIFESRDELGFAREVMIQIGRELTPQTPLGYGDQATLVVFHNTVPNNTLPVFWSNGRVNEKPWVPLFSRA